MVVRKNVNYTIYKHFYTEQQILKIRLRLSCLGGQHKLMYSVAAVVATTTNNKTPYIELYLTSECAGPLLLVTLYSYRLKCFAEVGKIVCETRA